MIDFIPAWATSSAYVHDGDAPQNGEFLALLIVML